MKLIAVSADAVTLKDAVESYLFNSQLISLPDGSIALVAPTECRENARVKQFLDTTSFDQVHFVDVRQSMQNGGGPACLRLRVVLTDEELARTHQRVLLTDELYARLQQWIGKHYREQIEPRDLVDPKLLDECRAALDELTQILALPPVYEFQR